MKNCNKIIFIVPPGGWFPGKNQQANFPPLGLCYLVAVLRERGVYAEIIDSDMEGYTYADIENRIKKENPDIVGVSFTTQTRFPGFNVINRVKKSLPHCLVIAGGPHVTNAYQDTLMNLDELDIIVRGEAEHTILDIVSYTNGDIQLEEIQGISYKRDGKVINNPNRPHIEDLDELPFPARDTLNMKNYMKPIYIPGLGKKRATSIITSRGCPFKCSFCSVTRSWGYKWRRRTAENIIEEIKHLVAYYGAEVFYFWDDTFTIDKERIKRICEFLITQGINIKWQCDIRVDTVDRELLSLMKEAGCFSVVYGAESGSQKILNNVINKKITVEQILSVDSWCKELGLRGQALFITSFPGESFEDALETIQLVKKLKCESSMSLLSIYPGTEIESIAREKGILPEDFSWSNSEITMFTHRLPGVIDNIPIYKELMSWEEIGRILFSWAKISKIRYWNRLLKVLAGIKSKDDVKTLSTMLKVFVRSRFYKI